MESLRMNIGHVFEAVYAVTRLKLRGEYIDVVQTVVSDHKGLASFFGTMGASAIYPCIFCYVTQSNLRDVSAHGSGSYRLRTMEVSCRRNVSQKL